MRLFVYDTGVALMTFLMAHGFNQKLPPPDRFRSQKSKAARKKRRNQLLRPPPNKT
jgi:hypothetical protein